MKNAIYLWAGLIMMSLAAGCSFFASPAPGDEPMPVVRLVDRMGGGRTDELVMLRIDYGLIVYNGRKGKPPQYRLYDRRRRDCLVTEDIDAFIEALEEIPDGAEIDMIDKCTVGFHSPIGVQVEKEYARIMELLKKKRCRLIESFEDDMRHTFFCYCEYEWSFVHE